MKRRDREGEGRRRRPPRAVSPGKNLHKEEARIGARFCWSGSVIQSELKRRESDTRDTPIVPLLVPTSKAGPENRGRKIVALETGDATALVPWARFET